MNQIKKNRINEELVRTISYILANESTDKLLKTITITGADVSDDLSFAKIYFTSLSDLNKNDITKEVNEASKMVRKFVASKMNLRQTPNLRFIYDESIEYGNKCRIIYTFFVRSIVCLTNWVIYAIIYVK